MTKVPRKILNLKLVRHIFRIIYMILLNIIFVAISNESVSRHSKVVIHRLDLRITSNNSWAVLIVFMKQIFLIFQCISIKFVTCLVFNYFLFLFHNVYGLSKPIFFCHHSRHHNHHRLNWQLVNQSIV